jgi:hypothetical protein
VPVPRVIGADTGQRIQRRERLHGINGEAVEPMLFGIVAPSSIARGMPDGRLRLDEACPLSAFGARLAESYGDLCARMHAAVSIDDARAFGLREKPRTAIDHLQFVSPSAERYPSIVSWITATIERLVP